MIQISVKTLAGRKIIPTLQVGSDGRYTSNELAVLLTWLKNGVFAQLLFNELRASLTPEQLENVKRLYQRAFAAQAGLKDPLEAAKQPIIPPDGFVLSHAEGK